MLTPKHVHTNGLRRGAQPPRLPEKHGQSPKRVERPSRGLDAREKRADGAEVQSMGLVHGGAEDGEGGRESHPQKLAVPIRGASPLWFEERCEGEGPFGQGVQGNGSSKNKINKNTF